MEKCREIILNCDLNQVGLLVDRLDDALAEIHRLAQEEDIRSYVFLVAIIEYCKIHRKEAVPELLHMAAFITLIFFNYMEGMIPLSYQHQKEAILLAPENEEYKKVFMNMYIEHPDVDHDKEFEAWVKKSVQNI